MEFADIHSHILYGLDDGAKTIEDSMAMLELAASDGTTDIVATPHANGQYAYDPEVIDQRIAELSARRSASTAAATFTCSSTATDARPRPSKVTRVNRESV